MGKVGEVKTLGVEIVAEVLYRSMSEGEWDKKSLR